MGLKQVYAQRAILWGLVCSNFKGQYKNSKLGILWQFITPAIIVILFYIVFTSIRISNAEDFWLLLCVGIFPYTFMESAIVSGSMCLVTNGHIIKKMYFPREIIVIAHVIVALITFIITFTLILILGIVMGHDINLVYFIELIPVTFITLIFNIGMALLLSSIVVYFRDLGYFINAVARLMFWMSPTIYTIRDVSGILKEIMMCNPLTYFISCYHELIYYNNQLSIINVVFCISLAILVLVAGLVVFKKLEGGFAERL